jgi:hypothetical protein
MPKKKAPKKPATREKRGYGHLYQKKDASGHVASTRYYWKYISPVDGNPHVETTHTDTLKAAEAWRINRMNELNMGEGRPAGGAPNPTIQTLYETLKAHYRRKKAGGATRRAGGRLLKNGSFANLELHWRQLGPVFAKREATSIKATDIGQYIDRRREHETRLRRKPTNATINRELSTLRFMFTIGKEYDLVRTVPTIKLEPEDNVRPGFIEDKADFKKLLGAAKEPWLRLFLTIALTYGWRSSEIVADRRRYEKGLHVEDVNFKANTLSLRPGSTKSGKGRTVLMNSEVRNLVRKAAKGKQPHEYLLTRADGSTVYDFRRAWWRLCCSIGKGQLVCPKCEAANPLPKPVGLDIRHREHRLNAKGVCPVCAYDTKLALVPRAKRDLKNPPALYVGLLVHDLRRSAAKKLLASGLPSKLVMDAAGWETPAMIDRYNIPSPGDMKAVLAKISRPLAG